MSETYAAPSELGHYPPHFPGASRFAALSALPLAITFRAFGAQEKKQSQLQLVAFQLEFGIDLISALPN